MSVERPGLRVLIAFPQPFWGAALEEMLVDDPSVERIVHAPTQDEAIWRARAARTEVAVVDDQLPPRGGAAVTERLTRLQPSCRVVLLGDDGDQTALLRAVEAGASAYVTRQQPLDDLRAAITRVHAGETIIPSHMLGLLLDDLLQRTEIAHKSRGKLDRLTPREREVLALMVEGADNRSIANALTISPQTARTHVQNLLTKLEVHSRLEAVSYVNNSGLRSEVVPANSL